MRVSFQNGYWHIIHPPNEPTIKRHKGLQEILEDYVWSDIEAAEWDYPGTEAILVSAVQYEIFKRDVLGVVE